MALALLRLPAATDHLVALVGDPSRTVAAAALAALAVQRYDPRVRERAEAAVAATGDARLRAEFAKPVSDKRVTPVFTAWRIRCRRASAGA